jgi:hypothetical protein
VRLSPIGIKDFSVNNCNYQHAAAAKHSALIGYDIKYMINNKVNLQCFLLDVWLAIRFIRWHKLRMIPSRGRTDRWNYSDPPYLAAALSR